jgi:hypothetical protein
MCVCVCMYMVCGYMNGKKGNRESKVRYRVENEKTVSERVCGDSKDTKQQQPK